MSSSRAAAPAGPKPLFGVEIEIYVKVHSAVEQKMWRRGIDDPFNLPEYWLEWDFSLENGQGEQERKEEQRGRVGRAIMAIIDRTLGPDSGWSCESDASLKEWQLTQPPDPRKWCRFLCYFLVQAAMILMCGLGGIEIISPPMSVTAEWQEEIITVFEAVGRTFDFWTNECCACHVHVSPGPLDSSGYTMNQLVQVAQGAYFWEDALCDLIPPERRNNRYANPNYTAFATDEYHAVKRNGWAPVFSRLTDLSRLGQASFVKAMKGGPGPNETRYISTNYDPLARLGTIELRRQAGVASATSAIHRVLLAVTLHVSARRYNFATAARRKDYPLGDELIRELAGCIKQLPKTCHGSKFVAWLRWCEESYANSNFFSEKQINARERSLRAEDSNSSDAPRSGPSSAPPRPTAPSARGPRAPAPVIRETPRTMRLPERPAPQSRAPAQPAASRPRRRETEDESPVRRPLARRPLIIRDDSPPAARRPAQQRARDESPVRRPIQRRPREEATVQRPVQQQLRDESPVRRPLARRPRQPPVRQESGHSGGRPVVYDDYVDQTRYQQSNSGW